MNHTYTHTQPSMEPWIEQCLMTPGPCAGFNWRNQTSWHGIPITTWSPSNCCRSSAQWCPENQVCWEGDAHPRCYNRTERRLEVVLWDLRMTTMEQQCWNLLALQHKVGGLAWCWPQGSMERAEEQAFPCRPSGQIGHQSEVVSYVELSWLYISNGEAGLDAHSWSRCMPILSWQHTLLPSQVGQIWPKQRDQVLTGMEIDLGLLPREGGQGQAQAPKASAAQIRALVQSRDDGHEGCHAQPASLLWNVELQAVWWAEATNLAHRVHQVC